MIDFRYHLVSLISVFLALAVGIVLGAGPLREGIGDTLTGQVEALRADRDQIRAELEERTIDTNDRDSLITAVTSQLAADTLVGQTAAVVVLPGAQDDDVTAVTAALAGAGAAITAEVRLADWSQRDASFLQTFAQQVAGYLTTPAAGDARPEGVLATATAQMLTRWGTADDDRPGVLAELLGGGDDPLVRFEQPVAAAGSVVIVGPRPTPLPDVAAATPTATIDPTLATVDWAHVVAATAATAPTVTVGAAEELVLGVRQAGVPTTPIDSVGEIPAAATVPFALAAELTGLHGRYGSAASAQAPFPALVRVPDPAPTAPEPTASPTAEATGADG